MTTPVDPKALLQTVTTELTRLQAVEKAVTVLASTAGTVTKGALKTALAAGGPPPTAPAPTPTAPKPAPAPTPPAPTPPMPAPAPPPVTPPAPLAPWPFAGGRDEFLKPIPANPVLDPNSATLAQRLTSGNRVGLTELYTSPIYTAAPTDPLHSVARGNLTVDFPDGWGDLDLKHAEFRVPDGIEAAPGSDGWVTIEDKERRVVVSMWRVVKVDGVLSCTSGGIYSLDGPPWTHKVAYSDPENDPVMRPLLGAGIHRDEMVKYLWKQPLTQATASGVSLLAGTITADDLASGTISHALVCAIGADMCAGPSRKGPYRHPAKSTDGRAPGPFDPKTQFIMGQRIQLDPAQDLSKVAHPVVRMVGQALQTRGVYIVDTGGSTISIGFERANTPAKRAIYDKFGIGRDGGYLDLSALPWGSARVLRKWDGT